jgi:hypothetical protein
MAVRLVADIKPEFQDDNIKHLVLEEDILGSGGYFIFLHERLDSPCLYDYWYETIEEAKSAASEMWGILEDDWKPSPH